MRNRHLYPPNWKQISLRCRELAGWKCEECGIAQGDERTSRRGNVYHVALAACHRDHTARKLEDAALVCLCERCHWWHDFRLWQLDEWRKLEQAKHRRLIAQAVKIGRIASVAFLATPAQASAALACQ
jgi:ssDNA-binding Zn-finger/Zn-ribbon topoisomerase 1